MADITVRKIRFDFDDPVELLEPDVDLASTLPLLGLSLTMPYLEPYLMRTMKTAQKVITDPQVAEDAKNFSQQEGHHFRNHAVFNEKIRDAFDEGTAAKLRRIEDAIEADYQRFTRGKSLRFNVAYAEGFEAMTCSGALAMATHGTLESASMLPGGELWAWHMAEEIEHRTVAFDVFEHLDGSYLYRITVGTWSQIHYLRYINRFARCMAEALGTRLTRPRTPMHREAARRYLRTLRPSYHPSEVEVPAIVGQLLARYDQRAASAAAS